MVSSAIATSILNIPPYGMVYLGMSLIMGLRSWNRSVMRQWREAADEGLLALLHASLPLLFAISPPHA